MTPITLVESGRLQMSGLFTHSIACSTQLGKDACLGRIVVIHIDDLITDEFVAGRNDLLDHYVANTVDLSEHDILSWFGKIA